MDAGAARQRRPRERTAALAPAPVTRPGRCIEIPAVRITVENTTGLGALQGRVLRTHADAARVLAPFLDSHPRARRLAAALSDESGRLLAVALFDGERDSACCLRPSDLCEALIVAGGTSAWLAHGHRSKHLWFVRQDVRSSGGAQPLMASLGLALHDSLILGPSGYVSWREADAQHAFAACLRGRERAFPRVRHALPAPPAARPVASPPRSHHVAFALVGRRTLRLDSAGLRLTHRPHVASAADLAPFLLPFLDAAPWVAALLDRNGRLIAVALLDSAPDTPCALAPSEAFRAAIVLGTHRLCLAHRHSTAHDWPSRADRTSAQRAHATGFELGRELCDVLVFGPDDGWVSLRTLGAGVPDWDKALSLRDPTYPARRMHFHQANANRAPTARHTHHATAARAALWRCTACGRRQNNKSACRYCGATRRGQARKRSREPR